MRASWFRLWSRFAPLWVTLWLLTPFLGSAAMWTHHDGSVCIECLQQAPTQQALVLPDECCPIRLVLTAPVGDDCRSCCSRTEPNKTSVLQVVKAPAILPTVVVHSVVLAAKNVASLRTIERAFEAAPRGPPRGRAPPQEIQFRI